MKSRLKEVTRVMGCWMGLSLCLMTLMYVASGSTTWLSTLASGIFGAAATVWAFSE